MATEAIASEKVTADGKTFTILYADLLRPLTRDEFDALAESIRKSGVTNPVIVDSFQTMGIIDGIHRVRAYARLEAEGVQLPDLAVRMPDVVLNEQQQRQLALELNLNRRQLTAEEVQRYRSNAEKRIAVEAALKVSPEKSDRAIAEETGCTHPFVAKVRNELSGNGYQMPEVRQVERGGKTYTQNTANIGKRLPAPVTDEDGEDDSRYLDPTEQEQEDHEVEEASIDRELAAQVDEADADGDGSDETEPEQEQARPQALEVSRPDPETKSPADRDEIAERERQAEIARLDKERREQLAQQREQSRREDLERRAAEAIEAPANVWDIRLGDCIDGLANVKSSARLVFADPPYNIGWDYGDGIKSDLLAGFQFVDWCREWLRQIPDVLTDDGSFWLLISDEYAAEIKIATEGAGLFLRQWLIWYESFGVNCSTKFNRTHRHLLHFVKDESNFVFHDQAPEVRRPSDRQTKYGDARAAEGGKLWDSVWGINPPIPRVCGTHREAIPGSPAPQLPLALLTPIIACSSDPGDLIVDPFAGNATTGVAAINLGRRFMGFEKREPIHQLAMLRMKAAWSELNRKDR